MSSSNQSATKSWKLLHWKQFEWNINEVIEERANVNNAVIGETKCVEPSKDEVLDINEESDEKDNDCS